MMEWLNACDLKGHLGNTVISGCPASDRIKKVSAPDTCRTGDCSENYRVGSGCLLFPVGPYTESLGHRVVLWRLLGVELLRSGAL